MSHPYHTYPERRSRHLGPPTKVTLKDGSIVWVAYDRYYGTYAQLGRIIKLDKTDHAKDPDN